MAVLVVSVLLVRVVGWGVVELMAVLVVTVLLVSVVELSVVELMVARRSCAPLLCFVGVKAAGLTALKHSWTDW